MLLDITHIMGVVCADGSQGLQVIRSACHPLLMPQTCVWFQGLLHGVVGNLSIIHSCAAVVGVAEALSIVWWPPAAEGLPTT
jgi:hypothetical protein